jgi:GDP-D-mannose dehydratase
MARFEGLTVFGSRNDVTLRSMSPTDLQSVANVNERVQPAEIYDLSGISSAELSCARSDAFSGAGAEHLG